MQFDQTIRTKKYFANRKNTCKYIMLHHTASNAPDINQARYLANHRAQVSCHYVVWKDGHIRQIADDNKCTWHAGTWYYAGIRNAMNMHAIGIEVCSDGYHYTDVQREATNNLVKHLMAKHRIQHKKVIRHLDYTKRKRDIGDAFWNNQYSSYGDYQMSLAEKQPPQPEPVADDPLVALGVRNGKRSNEPATRQEVARMLARVMRLIKDDEG